ncbi:ATPase AAA [Alistipes onderdonkii subsp. vulgaris]|uniref:ATP-binding protein n=1 Tax=Alistipes onderdonkii TaxID=328813 RepID=UPI0011421B8E|nr:AAA family ATPase [Alistipes onderdonkii]BBL00362.1 ATPase AAA [Alistipes onderdonkii subsp. vulgaris]
MLDRKIINKLKEWKISTNRKALLIKGARQVGKTTSIRHFGKENYKNYIEINFEKTPLARQAFSGNLDAKTIILNLSAMGYGPFEKGETLVFFDEIQSCPEARTSIKFLVEDGSYDYIESGSLLGINYKEVSSYPVGFEEQIDMFPLDFEEFLWAGGVSRDVIALLRQAYETVTPLPDFLHEQIMTHFRQFLIVGGMPEAVMTFLANDDITKTLKVQAALLDGYRNDIAKYAGSEKHLAKKVFDAIPEQLCKKDKRFILASLEKGASQRKYGDATEWLVDAGIAYFSFNVGAFELPFSFSEKRNLYKLFMLDTGLLSSMSLKNMQFQVLNGEIDINEGALTENYVATELIKRGIGLNYYDKKSKQELDFIFLDENVISIIEVKSGDNYRRHASLDAAIDAYEDKIGRAMVFSKFNVEKTANAIYYPLYMTMFL